MNLRSPLAIIGLVAAALMVGLLGWAQVQQRSFAALSIDPDDIGGVVTGVTGPEAGVWVIAEAMDLETRFIRIVVTDDEGRFVLPDLPRANYEVFVRGYGLIDSPRIAAVPGQQLDLSATAAPDGRSAAQVYPANYWLSLAAIPDGSLDEQEVVSAMKACMACHQIGDEATREIPESLGTFASSLEAWDRRVQSGQHGFRMSGEFMRLGPQRAFLPAWTDRIAAGDFPQEAPPRPSGVERNVVITMWDWSRPTSYVHDASPGDKRDPSHNANGLVYGAVQSDDVLAWVNPLDHTTGEIPVTVRDPRPATRRNLAPSPYYGEGPLDSAVGSPRNPMADHQGRLWVSVAIRAPEDLPPFCREGSSNRFTEYFPRERTAKQIAVFDPRTEQWSHIDTCSTTEHFDFVENTDHTVFTGQGDAFTWIDTRVWDETKDAEASQGWCPAVIDTNGDGRITDWTEPDQAPDPTKDQRINFGCYSISVDPNDGSVWCGGGGSFNRGNYLVRLERGSNPPQTCQAEVYAPPAGVIGPGHLEVATDGVVWGVWRSTDHFTSFDRRKCQGPLNGPNATGEHCPEGWTIHSAPGPYFEGTTHGTDLFYLPAVDKFNTLGLGTNVPLAGGINSGSLIALPGPDREWTQLTVPYPMGYFSRALHGRIDDPNTGWKGRGLWSNFSPYALWHVEGGPGTRSKLVKFQVRPDPLAK